MQGQQEVTHTALIITQAVSHVGETMENTSICNSSMSSFKSMQALLHVKASKNTWAKLFSSHSPLMSVATLDWKISCATQDVSSHVSLMHPSQTFQLVLVTMTPHPFLQRTFFLHLDRFFPRQEANIKGGGFWHSDGKIRFDACDTEWRDSCLQKLANKGWHHT